MNCHRLFLGFFLWLIPFTLSAQRTVSGRVTDAETGDPIPGAAVFIANTTVGATTDANGNYQLKLPASEGSYRLAVSHVAYQPVFCDIEPGKMSQIIDVAMQIREMEEIAVSTKVRFRKSDIDLFWKSILGRKPSKTIYPLNPEAVYYYFNYSTSMLTVTCRVPLQIVNYETGYHIQYVLDHFTHDNRKNVTVWEGECLFTELEPKTEKQKNVWDKNRKYVNSVSIANFIKSLDNYTLQDNGFLLVGEHKETFRGSKIIHDPSYGISATTTIFKDVEKNTIDKLNPNMFLYIDSITGGKNFYIPPNMYVMLISYGRPVPKWSWSSTSLKKTGLFRNLVSTPDTVQIFSDGSYKNWISFYPVYESASITGLHLVLPKEYLPDGATGNVKEKRPMKILSADPLSDTLFRVADHFERQLNVFPQEKIHLHIDKPYYIAGERIWFRAHVVDAATHVPSFSSGSVYVELFDARDSIVCRVKTGLANDLFSGYILIPEDTPEGDYTLRAYTNQMRNLEEDYFFMKNIRIGDPLSRMIHAQPEFEFLTDKKIGATFRFSPASPTSLKVSINNQNPVNLKSIDGKSGLSFNLSPVEKQRVMLLEAMYEKKPFHQYIKIPLPDDDFDVSFYPEGGSALYGCRGRMTVKAMQRDGTEIDVDGIIFDSRGNEMGPFKTDVRGMGQFSLTPERGESYYAVCTNSKGQSKRFDLPAAKGDGYALSALWFRDRLIVNVLQPESQKTDDTLCLIVHSRGVVQDVRILAKTNEAIYYPKDFFPSGVNHLLLLTKDMIPVSERLVFVNNDDQAKVEGKSDKKTYTPRSPVAYTVNITDKAGEPLHGNFSVSVTDDHVVTADSAANILTSLLLSSDLRGAIPDPAYYFRKNNRSAADALDLLMLTQGWRRYDTERILKNHLMQADTIIEKGYDVTGMVRNDRTKRPVENAPVSILSMDGGFATETVTDRNGRFYLHAGTVADSTRLIVQTTPQLGRQNLELTLDKVSYPDRILPVVAFGSPEREVFAQYVDKAEQQYVDEHGTRIIQIEEVTITAQTPKKNIVDYSSFYKPKDITYCITEDDMDKFPLATVRSLLMRIPGIMVSGMGEEIEVTYGRNPVLLRVDDRPEKPDFVVEQLNPHDIAQVDYLTGPVAAIFALDPRSYVISIYTKRGRNLIPKETLNMKHLAIPLGFQKPAEFYAPKYDTPAQNIKPDLRTTIHWQPNITTDEKGTASFSFYTADAPSTYTVTIEGITEDGKIVYKRDKIVVND